MVQNKHEVLAGTLNLLGAEFYSLTRAALVTRFLTPAEEEQ
jgi:hypothetical protein